jgi:mono-ADP-ribosyltransferase sirtuin 6
MVKELCLTNSHKFLGSSFKLVCGACKKYFYTLKGVEQNETLRCISDGTCPCCFNTLHGTGVGFGSDLPEDEWKKAKEAAQKSDLALVLGTSLRVSPACNLVEHSYKNKGHLVIVNLQITPYDKYAALVIRAKTDDVMNLLMKELKMKPSKPPKHLKLNPSIL